MKKVCSMLIVMVMLFTVLSVGASRAESHDHSYKLFLRQDNSGYYVCICVICNEVLDVYPGGFNADAAVQAAGEACIHLFRKAEKAKRISIEPAGSQNHESAAWYDCICEYCGVAFEAYETDGIYYGHEVTVWEDIHINGDFRHLYVGHCDACGALQYDIVNCAQYKDGSCMGGWDSASTVFE